MINTRILATTLLCVLVAPACRKTPHQQRQGVSVPNVTNDQSAGTDTVDGLEAKNAALRAQQRSAQVQANFMQQREAYRQKVAESLSDLDRKVAILEGKAKHADGKARNTLEMGLTQIRADRFAFIDDYKSLDTATSTTWDSTKARLDKEWTQLSSLVDRS